jgi:hypothetical protein
MPLVKSVDVRASSLLNEIYREPKIGAEIGVYRGDLSCRLLGANRNLFLYMVDPWAEVESGNPYLETDDHISRFTQAEHDEVMRKALLNVSVFSEQCKVMRMTSECASRFIDDSSLDFVFIDADHSYAGCSQDIALWYPKLKHNGLLSGHDYRDERNYGVQRAVDEFAAQSGKEVKLGGNYTWFIVK